MVYYLKVVEVKGYYGLWWIWFILYRDKYLRAISKYNFDLVKTRSRKLGPGCYSLLMKPSAHLKPSFKRWTIKEIILSAYYAGLALDCLASLVLLLGNDLLLFGADPSLIIKTAGSTKLISVDRRDETDLWCLPSTCKTIQLKIGPQKPVCPNGSWTN